MVGRDEGVGEAIALCALSTYRRRTDSDNEAIWVSGVGRNNLFFWVMQRNNVSREAVDLRKLVGTYEARVVNHAGLV